MSFTSHHARLETGKAPLHVLIIGGGLGGLCLAQGLKKAGISVAVYERDQSALFHQQGYRISLKAEGSEALRACLPTHLFQLCVATAIHTATRMIFLDDQLQQKFARPLPDLPADSSFGVNRLTLREILLAELAEIVHFGKTFTRFEQAEHGQIRALFADNSVATGDLLVGADGTHSAVRKQLIPDAVIAGIGSFIYGKTPLTARTLSQMPDVLIDSFNRMSNPAGIAMSVATCRKREEYALATARLAPAVHLTEVQDYFAWMLEGPPTRSGEQLRTADARTLHHLSLQMLQGWPVPLQQIVERANIPDTFLVHLHSARPVQPWQTSNVTLLGDAIHTMSPGRGEGANTALRDAALLCQTLLEVGTQAKPLAQTKAQYETTMLRYGFEAVANSLERPFAPTNNRQQT